LPMASNTFNYETFSLRFLVSYLKFDSENKKQRIFEYFRSKLTSKWIFHTPKDDDANLITLAKVDSAAVKAGIEEYYIMGKDTKRFATSCEIIEDEIKFAQKHNTEVIFVIPPAVFGKWPGHEMTVDFAKKMEEKYHTRYYDFSESIMDPKYYYDHHHLNTAGVVLFGEKFLKPVL
jgi:hypothetical protein